MGGEIPTVNLDLGQINIGIGASFSEIPEQVRERSIREGFRFNLLVVGRRGLGCSTLINSLFCTKLVQKDRNDSINTSYGEIIEGNVVLNISVTTYHGEDFDKILEYIEKINEEYYEQEQGLNMPFIDKRIHCCLYLTPGDKISEKEITGVKELSQKVNLIPLVTKADMFTENELQEHRGKINMIFEEFNRNFYDYGENGRENFPMALIASEETYMENGFEIRARKYPWGTINIENKRFSDFKKLQRIIIGERFIDLINRTDNQFYSNSRRELIKKETPTVVKQRLMRIIGQLENTIEEKYNKILERMNKKDNISESVNEISLECSSKMLSS